MKPQHTLHLKLCFALVVVLLSACTKQESSLKDSEFAGVYALVTVNGNPIPASITHGGATLQVRSGIFTITADGTCSTKTTFLTPSGTEAAREVSATYKREGAKLIMQWKGAGETVGTLQGNTFTMDNEGIVFVYKK